MKNSFFITILLNIVFLPAIAANIDCPDMINTHQSLQKKVNGWREFLDDWNLVHRFNRVTFYANDPKQHASLAPDNTKNSKAIWTFGKDKIWLACGYSNTDIQLIRRLPDGVKKCTVTYVENFKKIAAIHCS